MESFARPAARRGAGRRPGRLLRRAPQCAVYGPEVVAWTWENRRKSPCLKPTREELARLSFLCSVRDVNGLGCGKTQRVAGLVEARDDSCGLRLPSYGCLG